MGTQIEEAVWLYERNLEKHHAVIKAWESYLAALSQVGDVESLVFLRVHIATMTERHALGVILKLGESAQPTCKLVQEGSAEIN